MTEAARQLLMTFESLAPTDQEEVVAVLLRRAVASEELPEDALHELADELFRVYDAEEATHAAAQSRLGVACRSWHRRQGPTRPGSQRLAGMAGSGSRYARPTHHQRAWEPFRDRRAETFSRRRSI
jgi:hypothetical protein